MKICAFTKEWYGQRIVKNIKEKGPGDWIVEEVDLSSVKLPTIVDEPEDFVPEGLPEAELVLFLAQDPELIQLLSAIVSKTRANAVIIAIDKSGWLQRGLQLQMEKELTLMDVPYVFARPLCTLTNVGNHMMDEFAKYFGKPKVEIMLKDNKIEKVKIKRGALCGCTEFIAEGLEGISVDNAVEKAGLLFHNYPCLASMSWDDYVGETLMHIAGFKTKDAIRNALKE